MYTPVAPSTPVAPVSAKHVGRRTHMRPARGVVQYSRVSTCRGRLPGQPRPDMSYPVRTPGYRDDDPDLLLAIALSKSLMARPPLEQAWR